MRLDWSVGFEHSEMMRRTAELPTSEHDGRGHAHGPEEGRVDGACIATTRREEKSAAGSDGSISMRLMHSMAIAGGAAAWNVVDRAGGARRLGAWS